MSISNAMQGYGPILYHYDLFPNKIEDFGKVKKIYTNRGEFALKQSNMNREQAEWLVHVARRLMKLGYRNCVPLLPTKYGEYTLTTNNETFYLMPWIYESEDTREEILERALVKQMGTIHRLTVKAQPYSKETINESYSSLQKRWDLRRLDLEKFAVQAEKKTYMSPYELTFLSHYHHLSTMMDDANDYLKNWYDATMEKEKYRSVLCHGRLSRRHVLLHESGELLLFNFERSTLDCPARDLATFYRHSFPHALWDDEEILNWYAIYEKELSLYSEEKQLLCGYLNYPEAIIHSVYSYIKKPAHLTELQHVKRLEKRLIAMRKASRFTKKIIDSTQPQ